MASNLDFNAFTDCTTSEWKAQVERELKGKPYDEYLTWTSLDGFEIDSWQNQKPEVVCTPPTLSKSWSVLEKIIETDATKANKLALDALMAGAEAIWFQKPFRGAAIEVVKRQIDTEVAPVFINGSTIYDPFRSLLKDAGNMEYMQSQIPYFNGRRLRERGATPVQEIAVLLAQAVAFCRHHGFDQSFYFLTANGSSYLTELAKIRALRWLWANILQHEGGQPKNPSIIATNLTNAYSRNDEHTNILRATTSCMAGAVGGAQFIMIEPWDWHWKEQNELSSRITRNIQNLLKDESRFTINLNPADGSYFLENLTTTIAKAAWTYFQQIEEAGGFNTYAKTEALKEALEKSKSAIIERVTINTTVVLNVNKYTAADAKPDKVPDKPVFRLLPDYLYIPNIAQKS